MKRFSFISELTQTRLTSRQFHSSRSLFSSSSSPSRITYRIAVSSSDKSRRFHPSHNVYPFDPAQHDALGFTAIEERNPVLRRRERPDSGEDAFFVSKIGDQNPSSLDAVAFGVADGVGGWAQSRVDPGDFSHGLCGYMAHSALAWKGPADKLRAKNLLQVGYDRVLEDEAIVAGGSTASVGIGLNDGRVDLANLGDSGSILFRLAAVHHYSTPQTHSFNTPYQLSVIPPRMRLQASIFGGDYLQDQPSDAAVKGIQMQHGDVLILTTDGVFDNLNNQEILKLVTKRMVLSGAWTATDQMGISVSDDLDQLTSLSSTTPQQHSVSTSPSPSAIDTDDPTSHKPNNTVDLPKNPIHSLQALLATTIAGEAKRASHNFRRDGPFAKEVQRYYPGDLFRGGKVDDICVLVVVAVEEGRGQCRQT